MLFGKLIRVYLLKPVSGILLALFWLQLFEFIAPNLISPLTLTVEAATGTINPDGNGTTVQGTVVSCSPSTQYGCIDDGVTDPTSPGTSDYTQFLRTELAHYTMDNSITNASVVTSITVHMYHLEGASNYVFQVGLYDSNETTQFGSTQTLTNTTSAGWGSVTMSSLSLTQTQLNNLRIRTTCARPSGGGNSYCRDYALYAVVTYTPVINLTVAALGTQQNLDVGITNQHVGGAFSLVSNVGTWPVTQVVVSENGSVDAQNDLKNIKLYYEYDTSSPFSCASEGYGVGGAETQFGSTIAGGFTGADGTATFTGSTATASTTQTICLYVILSPQTSADAGDQIEIEISAPQSDITATGGPNISPATAIAISGSTILQKTVLTQGNYHWRDDNGDETDTGSGASSATAGSESTPYDTLPKNSAKRIRLAVSNEGNRTSDATQYRLEYAAKSGLCSAATGWTDVDSAGGDFDMFNTGNLTNGNNTTNIAVSSGGVTNAKTFITTNGGVRDTTSQTGNITLTSTEYVELEYSIIASLSVAEGNSYCFRVTNAGSEIVYSNYPEATIAADLSVTASGTQSVSSLIPSVNNYGGGLFVISDNAAGVNTINSIIITASGTADTPSVLENIQLRYDFDTTNPYICDGKTYSISDPTFGSATSTSAGRKATFNDTATTSPTKSICLYVEYDVTGTANDGDIVEIFIEDPSTEIDASGATIAPAAAENISGDTELQKSDVSQFDYHWGTNETSATSATDGTENTPLDDAAKNTIYRLRFSIGNTGLADAVETRYRIQWKQKISTCSAGSWIPMDTASDAWEMAPTALLTEGGDTTDISEDQGGVGDPATTFLANNNGTNDTTDLTASSTLLSDNYMDLVYAISPTNDAVQGATYCFRVVGNGSDLNDYVNYAEATIKLDTDFKIQRGVTLATSSSVVIRAGTDYEAPASASSSFIRITNTQLTGAGPNSGNGNSNADDVTIYITNPDNILNYIIFSRAAFPSGNTRISWEIIEYTGVSGGENEIIVQNQDVLTYSSGNTTVNGPVVTGVTQPAVFITSQYNVDTGRNNFHLGISTAEWNTSNNQVVMTRGASGNASIVTYSLVDFTGSNWNVQRIPHTFSSANATETESMTSVNSLSKTFTHVQKRTAETNHADFGHEVWLSSVGFVSFKIDGAASTPSNHTSVAWVIENTQNQGVVMQVTRAKGGLTSGGSGPESNILPIGKTLDDLSITSLFVNNRSDGTSRSWPEPILGVDLISDTQYELWRSDTGTNIAYRTEFVEWPTAARKLEQNYYAIYENTSTSTRPFDRWGATNIGENTPMTVGDNPMAFGDIARIRMTLSVIAAAMPAGLDSFKLQFGEYVSSCNAVSIWKDVGEIGSTTALWRGSNNTPADGATLSSNPPTAGDLTISIASIAGTYEEENPSAVNPYTAFPGDELEYDWVVQHNGANDKTSYCFRMVEATGVTFTATGGTYNDFPMLRTVGYDPQITNWRWYDDETNVTPTTPLSAAAENVAPSDVENQNIIKLRVVLEESAGAAASDAKFSLQFSEYADFSQSVATVTATSTCTENSLWCFANGAGVDNISIDSAVISDADSCTGGSGNGCGTHNETATNTITTTIDQPAFSSMEFEFTIKHAGARASAVYYFRLYDVVNNEFVVLSGGASYPSLQTEGAQLVFSISGVDAETTIGDIVTDATTTATAITFGSIPIGSDVEAAQRITVNTNATEGYQVLKLADQQLLNSYGDQIDPITSTNATPAGWNTACLITATGCFGYHTTDGTLFGPSTRFGPLDSYAQLDVSAQEIMYSSIPTVDVHDIVYRIKVSNTQPSGDYQTSISYIAIPTF